MKSLKATIVLLLYAINYAKVLSAPTELTSEPFCCCLKEYINKAIEKRLCSLPNCQLSKDCNEIPPRCPLNHRTETFVNKNVITVPLEGTVETPPEEPTTTVETPPEEPTTTVETLSVEPTATAITPAKEPTTTVEKLSVEPTTTAKIQAPAVEETSVMPVEDSLTITQEIPISPAEKIPVNPVETLQMSASEISLNAPVEEKKDDLDIVIPPGCCPEIDFSNNCRPIKGICVYFNNGQKYFYKCNKWPIG